jgi:hypothetical protein
MAVELHNLYSAPNIVRVIQLRRLSWAGHKACMREMRITYKSQWKTWMVGTA